MAQPGQEHEGGDFIDVTGVETPGQTINVKSGTFLTRIGDRLGRTARAIVEDYDVSAVRAERLLDDRARYPEIVKNPELQLPPALQRAKAEVEAVSEECAVVTTRVSGSRMYALAADPERAIILGLGTFYGADTGTAFRRGIGPTVEIALTPPEAFPNPDVALDSEHQLAAAIARQRAGEVDAVNHGYTYWNLTDKGLVPDIESTRCLRTTEDYLKADAVVLADLIAKLPQGPELEVREAILGDINNTSSMDLQGGADMDAIVESTIDGFTFDKEKLVRDYSNIPQRVRRVKKRRHGKDQEE